MRPTDKLPPLPARLMAGVSGGADSVAMMLLLMEKGVQVTAVHVNHGLRGEASDGDEAFVRELCRARGVPLLAYRALPPDDPGEDWARQARYAFFRQAAAETGLDAIALAHHRDDQAETLLLHLLRGAGLTGLSAMAADSAADGLRILRPLLAFSREELRDWLTAQGQEWREDASNADPRYLRNALRRDVMPLLESLAPGASSRLAGTAALLRDEEALLAHLARDFLADHARDAHLPLAPLREQPVALQRRILRAWWQQSAGERPERSLSVRQTEELRRLVTSPVASQCNLPGGLRGQRGFTHLHLVGGEPIPLPETPVTECPLVELLPAAGRTGDGRIAQAIPRDMLPGLVVRSRRPGDTIRPFGSGGTQSLQDYLVNRRVDAAFRDRVPLVCRGHEALLVGGVGAGAIPHINKEDLQNCSLLCWRESFPWYRNDIGGT